MKKKIKKNNDDEEFFDDCPVCQTMKLAKEEGRELALSELKEAFEKSKEKGAIVGGKLFEEVDREEEMPLDLEYIGNAQDFKMPKWMECTWRRVGCGKDDCPICGRIKRDRQRHIEKNEDPDDMKSVFEDVGRNFKETLEIIKKDAESKGIDITNIEEIQEPPEPEEFPLYKKVNQWRYSVFEILERASTGEELWTFTETAEDLSWYSSLLPAKVYRQFCNQWEIEHGDHYGEVDYDYTKYIIGECLTILKKSLGELSYFNSGQKSGLILALGQLMTLEKDIAKI